MKDLIETGPIGSAKARDYFKQMIDAVSYLHVNGIIHRDLKPENLVFSDQPHSIIKICDFGVSKMVDGDCSTGTLCGTPGYMGL